MDAIKRNPYGAGFLAVVFVVGGALMLRDCQPKPKGIYVSREQMGDAWPLTVPDGYINCQSTGGDNTEDAVRVITFTVPSGVVYSVNGIADSWAKQYGWQDIRPIWADNPEGPGPKKNIGPLFDVCK